jgi:kinetochore protein NDC80
VKEQNISPEEVIRMNTDHEQLSRSLEDLKVKNAESQKTILSLEVSVANRGAAAEESVDVYTRLLSNLGLFPPLPPPFQDIDLQVELNTAASQTEDLLKGPDVRQVIRPTLNAVVEGKRSERAAVESERIRVDHELDQLILECENLEDEVNEMEKKVMVLNEQADDLREVSLLPFGLIRYPAF